MAVTTKRNVGKTVWIFFIVLIMIIIAMLIVTSLVFKNKDVTPSVFGYSVFVMDEDGMGDAVPEGALVVAKNYSPSNENLGDAILCEGVGGNGTTVLRLCDVVPNTKTVIYQGFFDEKPDEIYNIPASRLVGQAISYHKFWGAAISFVTSTKGMAVLVIVPLLILLLAELIIHLVGKSKARNNIHKDKFKKSLEQYKASENSPLNSKNIGSHTGGPVTIEDFIFGKEEAENVNKKSPTVEFKAEKSRQLEKNIEKIKAERSEKSAANTYKRNPPADVRENTVKLERVRVKKTEEKPEISERPDKTEEAKTSSAVKTDEIRTEEIKTGEVLEEAFEKKDNTEKISEISQPVISEAVADETAKASAEVKKEETAEEKISNSSLERLIKLMEEQEKILKSLADKDD